MYPLGNAAAQRSPYRAGPKPQVPARMQAITLPVTYGVQSAQCCQCFLRIVAAEYQPVERLIVKV